MTASDIDFVLGMQVFGASAFSFLAGLLVACELLGVYTRKPEHRR